MNKYVAIGNLTGKPTMGMTSASKPVCNMRIAINENFKDANGDKIHKVEFLNLTAWGDLATYCHEKLDKGTQIYFTGALKTSSWDRTVKSPSGEEIKVPTETKFISLQEVILLNTPGSFLDEVDPMTDIPVESFDEEQFSTDI